MLPHSPSHYQKMAFRDDSQYGWPPPLLPSHCVCGNHCTVEHGNELSKWFPSIRHREIRDLTAKILTETCHTTETPLQSLNDEQLSHKTANSENGTRLHIAADNF